MNLIIHHHQMDILHLNYYILPSNFRLPFSIITIVFIIIEQVSFIRMLNFTFELYYFKKVNK
jgi:hypothetical protein